MQTARTLRSDVPHLEGLSRPLCRCGKSHGQRSLIGYSPWGREESTRLSDFTFTFHFNALEKEMATRSSVLAWRIWWAAVYGVAQSRTRLSDFTFTFHFNALEKEMATHSSVLAWRIPGMGEAGGLPSGTRGGYVDGGPASGWRGFQGPPLPSQGSPCAFTPPTPAGVWGLGKCPSLGQRNCCVDCVGVFVAGGQKVPASHIFRVQFSADTRLGEVS